MPSSHLILCRPLLLPPIPPSIRVFSNESTLLMRWSKYWSFSFTMSPSNEHSGEDCIYFLKIYLFIYFWLHWVFVTAHWLFSSCSEQGLPSSCCAWASCCGGFSCCGAWALERRLSSCSSTACGIFQDQGSKRCPLHYKVES